MEYATEMPVEVSEINAGEIRESVQSASGQHRRTTEAAGMNRACRKNKSVSARKAKATGMYYDET